MKQPYSDGINHPKSSRWGTWKQKVYGTLTAMLLLPIPVLATSYSWNQPKVTNGTATDWQILGSLTSNSITVETFSGSGTVTIQITGTATADTNGSTVTTKGMSLFSGTDTAIVLTGNQQLSINVGAQGSNNNVINNNQFSAPQVVTAATLNTNVNATSGAGTITITFAFTNGSQGGYGPSTSSSTFTMTFH